MTINRETTRLDRAVARVLIFALATMNSLPAMAGDEFSDANSASFDEANVGLDNTRAGQTVFTIDTDQTTIQWENLEQPANNHLEFNFSETDGSARVLNTSRSLNPIALNGRTSSNGIVGFASDAGLFINGNAVIDVAGLVAISGNLSADAFTSGERFDLALTGDITNQGTVTADGNIVLLGRNVINDGSLESGQGTVLLLGGEQASIANWDSLTDVFSGQKDLFGLLGEGTITNNGRIEGQNGALLAGRVVNQGEIAVDDGTLLVVGADAVYVSQFDNPVLIRLPHAKSDAETNADGESSESSQGEDVEYAIENHGTINAGLGHVRLAASDPLGFGIRQGTGSGERNARIAAKKIDLEGGENGRVQLSGRIDADGAGKRGEGGEINVTGSIIALVDAEISASGKRGGGTIQIGGEQQGRGELQRARSVIMDADSSVSANATKKGDGGRVIVFAEDITSIDGELAARGGKKGGDGGFVETSGLVHFAISQTPDLAANQGDAGSWLIDPFNIRIGAEPAPCPANGPACGNLSAALEAIIAPNFDSTGFDGILRTVAPDPTIVGDENFISAALIERALGIGVDVTISTQVFGEDPNPDLTAGDIILEEAISLSSAGVREGTTATLTLLAAGDIFIDNAIEVVTGGARSNLALSIRLVANDAAQDISDRDFAPDLVTGDVLINADLTTGGGSVEANGISVILAAGQTIDTDGGSVLMRSGTLDANLSPTSIERRANDPAITDPIDGMGAPVTLNPRIEIAGQIDTRDFDEANENRDGGSINLIASSINVGVRQRGDDPLQIVNGLVTIDSGSTLQSGGGDITVQAGSVLNNSPSTFIGNVEVLGNLESRGGDVTIAANSIDPSDETSNFALEYLGDEGGRILVDGDITTEGGALLIGNSTAQSIQLDGGFDTRSTDPADNEDKNGLIRITALDSSAVDADESRYGDAEISIGTNGTTVIDTAGLFIETRDLTIGEEFGANSVSINLEGDSSANDPTLATNVVLADGSTQTVPNIASVGEAQFSGSRQIIFNQNTQVTGEVVRITAAADPIQGTDATRLTFGGTGGAAASGVRLNADRLQIAIGDRTTAIEDVGIERQTQGDYAGLQLRRSDSAALRPDEISIRQDADLIVSDGAPTGASQIDFAGAFGGSAIGSDGMRLTLESSDGILSVRTAAGLNNTSAFIDEDNDNGQSYVVLNGGLTPSAPNGSVVIAEESGLALGTTGSTQFDVRSLTVSTPGDLTITQVIADSINSAREWIFETGRETELEDAVEAGTLTVEANVSLLARTRLALQAAASGFGDLVFAGTGNTLSSDEIDLRAGAGTATQNSDNDARSAIRNLQSNAVAFRDGAGNTFGDDASSATAFSYRQDAAINGETDLANIDQFDLTFGTGFRAEGDVEYKIRSDFGQVDLDSGDPVFDANRVQNTALSLIGAESGGNPAIAIDEDFDFEGKRVELGGVDNFTFTQVLADAFNRTGMDADEEITLRAGAGLGSNGNLDFNRGNESSVLVKAPRINLIAGDGAAAGSGNNSDINVNNASFDLSGPVGAVQTFVYQVDDAAFRLSDLPDADQFGAGTSAELPDVLAIRNDSGLLNLEDFDVGAVPLDLTDDPGRLILESDTLQISRTDGTNLDFTANPNLNLRLRTNALILEATENNNDDFGVATNARVLIGARAGDGTALTGDDDSFSGRSLLIEAFDAEAEVATAANLSRLSEDPNNADAFDLTEGRAPTTISVQQDGAVVANELFLSTSVSGLLGRTIDDDEEEDEGEQAIATNYTIESVLDSVTIAAENVNGSALTLLGNVLNDENAGTQNGSGIAITLSSGSYLLESLSARTPDSILVEDGTSIQASETLALLAAIVSDFPDEMTTQSFGSLRFDDGSGGTTTLSANQIELRAGPAFGLTDPDADNDDERDEIDPATDPITGVSLLPTINFAGLAGLTRLGDLTDSSIRIQQGADLDSSTAPGDFVSPLGTTWEEVEVSSLQGRLTLSNLDALAASAETLIAASGINGSVLVLMPDSGASPTPFDDFEDEVRIESNEITFQTTDPGTSLNLASEKLRLVTGDLLDGTETAEDRFRVDSDPDSLDRPTITIDQVASFDSSEIPLPSQYWTRNFVGELEQRETLEDIEIVLKSDVSLTLDNDIRSRVSTANLRLESGGDVTIALNNQTEGFEDIEGYAALQLASLEIIANNGAGNITISDFTEAGIPANLSIETQGDQRFNGQVVLEETLQLTGRDLTFLGGVEQNGTPDAGLLLATRGQVRVAGDLGSAANPLDRVWALFDTEAEDVTPNLIFNGAGDQNVFTNQDIFFASGDLTDGTLINQIEAEISSVATLADLEALATDLELGRTRIPSVATVGKTEGNLTFDTANGLVGVTLGERIAVAGDFLIDADAGITAIGDVSAVNLEIIASAIGIVRRGSGSSRDRSGASQRDGGVAIIANLLDFGGVAPQLIGRGRQPVFGIPNPFDTSNQPDFLDDFAVFEINPTGSALTAEDFTFNNDSDAFAGQLRSIRPTGASRSDLSGANGPETLPTPVAEIDDPELLPDPSRLLELAVETRNATKKVQIARLSGAAIINDLDLPTDDESTIVTASRLDARDAESAIELYEELFGPEGERSDNVRAVLQDALDQYLETTRSRRVVGFELRRFVKNRPSTLLDAYATLEALDSLFRYHRRLGLSPGEYRRVQSGWLRQIQPDGISLDELAEAIHPSRYVRGSDILDIFGR